MFINVFFWVEISLWFCASDITICLKKKKHCWTDLYSCVNDEALVLKVVDLKSQYVAISLNELAPCLDVCVMKSKPIWYFFLLLLLYPFVHLWLILCKLFHDRIQRAQWRLVLEYFCSVLLCSSVCCPAHGYAVQYWQRRSLMTPASLCTLCFSVVEKFQEQVCFWMCFFFPYELCHKKKKKYHNTLSHKICKFSILFMR